MTRLLVLSLTIVSLLLPVSCDRQEYLKIELPDGATQLSFDKSGGHQTVSLYSSSDWTVGTLPDWVVLGFTSGPALSRSLKISMWVNPNTGRDRSCEIVFSNNESRVVVPVVQKGTDASEDPGTDPGTDPGVDPGTGPSTDYANAPSASVASFVITADPYTYYKLSGSVSSFNSSTFEMTLTDDTGSIYVYEVVNKSEWTGRIHENGHIILSGKYHYYSGKRIDEVVDAHILSFTPAGSDNEPIPVTMAEFNAAAASETQSYRLAGRMSNITNTYYGNFDLTDDTGTVFVYGLTATNLGFGTSNDKSFASLGLIEGDEIVIIGFRSNYNGNSEAKYSYFVEKTGHVDTGGGGGGDEDEPTIMLDFRKPLSELPQSNGDGLTDATYVWSGYSFTIHATSNFYQGRTGNIYYLLIGKQYSNIQLPVVSGKALTQVKFLTAPQASENVIIDIAKTGGTRLMVNDTKLKKDTQYHWTFSGEKDVAYEILITNTYNAQFQYISLYYE